MSKDIESTAASWFESLMSNPEEIIEWAESEIEEYKKLIKIIKKHKNAHRVSKNTEY